MSTGHFTLVGAPDSNAKFQIIGNDAQVVNIVLDPSEQAIAEPGSMLHMSDGIHSGVECHLCSTRCCIGESCISVVYTNQTEQPLFIGLTPWFPGKVVPIELSNLKEKRIFAKAGAYMAHYGDVNVGLSCDCNCCTCCCGGVGLTRQELSGTGVAFISAGGTVVRKVLQAGETLVIDTDSIVAWESSATFNIRRTGGCCTMCFGGEGIFNTTITGPGLVLLESMPFMKYKKALTPPPRRRVNH